MDCKIFYSWQSDLPNNTNRGFIQTALDKVVKSIVNDDSIEIEPVIDRDTQGVSGSPDIAATIFAKIEQANIFICDVSIINQNSEFRPTPNPNVLVELGYALKSLGTQNIILLMNTAFGEVELLPFDLRMKRVITYSIAQDATEKSTERKELEKKLKQSICGILNELQLNIEAQKKSISEQTRLAIEHDKPNQKILVRQFVEWFISELDRLKPDRSNSVIKPDDLLVQSINKSQNLTSELARVSETIALVNNYDAAKSLFSLFEKIANKYCPPKNFVGTIRERDFDFYKFVGHEAFVVFLSFLVREECWDTINLLLLTQIYIENYGYGNSGTFLYPYLSHPIKLLDYRKQRLQSNRKSIQADILNQHFSEGELSNHLSMQDFMDTDLFLYLYSKSPNNSNEFSLSWHPWTLIYMNQAPKYMVKAENKNYANQLAKILNIENIPRLKEFIKSEINELRLNNGSLFPFTITGNFDFERIGTQ